MRLGLFIDRESPGSEDGVSGQMQRSQVDSRRATSQMTFDEALMRKLAVWVKFLIVRWEPMW